MSFSVPLLEELALWEVGHGSCWNWHGSSKILCTCWSWSCQVMKALQLGSQSHSAASSGPPGACSWLGASPGCSMEVRWSGPHLQYSLPSLQAYHALAGTQQPPQLWRCSLKSLFPGVLGHCRQGLEQGRPPAAAASITPAWVMWLHVERMHLCFRRPLCPVGWLQPSSSCMPRVMELALVREQGRGTPGHWSC